MVYLRKTWLCGLICSLVLDAAVSYERRDSSCECSNDCVKEAIEEITQGCFQTTLPDTWDPYGHSTTPDCTSIRKVFSIVPQPAGTYFSLNGCYQKQKMACSTENFCTTYCTATKVRGQMSCLPKKPDPTITTTTVYPVPTMEATTTTTPTTEAAGAAAHKKKRDDCEECSSSSGVSAGVAAGLFVLGLVLGAIVAAVMCVCLPCCERKSSSLREKMGNKFPHMTNINTSEGAQDTEAPRQTATAPSPTQVSPGVSSPTYRDGYHTLSLDQNNRDSHTYTGIQPEGQIYTEPMDGTYEQASNGPIKSLHTVQSPIYNQFTDNDVVLSNVPHTNGPNVYQPLDHGRKSESPHKYGVIHSNNFSESQNSNQPITDAVTNEPANHNYLILEPEGEGQSKVVAEHINDNTTDGHQYFVLEKTESS